MHTTLLSFLELTKVLLLFILLYEDEYDAESGLKRVAEAAGKAHYIFISHPTLHHVGALPFLHKIGVMSNPQLKEIFATSPVAKIGA